MVALFPLLERKWLTYFQIHMGSNKVGLTLLLRMQLNCFVKRMLNLLRLIILFVFFNLFKFNVYNLSSILSYKEKRYSPMTHITASTTRSR